MQKTILMSGAIFGALAVAFGTFGAHALKVMLEAAGRTDTFETAVKYQFYHALALLLVGVFMQRNQDVLLGYSGITFIIGTIIFSGSLYMICFTGVTRWGAVAPVGGLAFIVGWILLLISFAKN